MKVVSAFLLSLTVMYPTGMKGTLQYLDLKTQTLTLFFSFIVSQGSIVSSKNNKILVMTDVYFPLNSERPFSQNLQLLVPTHYPWLRA